MPEENGEKSELRKSGKNGIDNTADILKGQHSDHRTNTFLKFFAMSDLFTRYLNLEYTSKHIVVHKIGRTAEHLPFFNIKRCNFLFEIFAQFFAWFFPYHIIRFLHA